MWWWWPLQPEKNKKPAQKQTYKDKRRAGGEDLHPEIPTEQLWSICESWVIAPAAPLGFILQNKGPHTRGPWLQLVGLICIFGWTSLEITSRETLPKKFLKALPTSMKLDRLLKWVSDGSGRGGGQSLTDEGAADHEVCCLLATGRETKR